MNMSFLNLVLLVVVVLCFLTSSTTHAFSTAFTRRAAFTSTTTTATTTTTTTTRTSSSQLFLSDSNNNNNNINDNVVVVISPPGGIGQSMATSAARLGAQVKWFIISTQPTVTEALAQHVLAEIEDVGGSIDLAGAQAKDVVSGSGSGTQQAISTWCGQMNANALLVTMDGIEDLIPERLISNRALKNDDTEEVMTNAILLAAREAARASSNNNNKNDVKRVAILSTEDDDDEDNNVAETAEGEGGKLLSLPFLGGGGDSQTAIPKSLTQALSVGGSSGSSVTILRHGELIGAPDSSPDYSPFVDGPMKEPKLRNELTLQNVRVDPTVSLSGNVLLSKNTRTTRKAVGDAAARMALGGLSTLTKNSNANQNNQNNNLDLCITSLLGSEPWEEESWVSEFQRLQQLIASGKSAQLFEAEFASVPDPQRLADWMAQKWAPAVLKTYDIAGIRVGARPVYATQNKNNNGNGNGNEEVEIVWQQLVNFESVTVGKMQIQISDTSLTATRGPGDASKGYGSISKKPLNGEDVLVRRLADAAAQAIEKGLAVKPKLAKPKKKAASSSSPKAVAVSNTVLSSGTVASSSATEQKEEKTSTAAAAAASAGPRSAGARRSAERTRGKRRKKKNESSSSDDDNNNNNDDDESSSTSEDSSSSSSWQ